MFKNNKASLAIIAALSGLTLAGCGGGSSMNEMMTGLKGIQATDEFASFVSEVADAREIIATIVTTDLATFGM